MWLAVVLVAVVGLTSSGLVGIAAAQDTAPTCSDVSFSGGDGSADDPYEIENVSQLQCIEKDLDAHYELVSDVDASATSEWNDGNGFEPIGSDEQRFVGTFDGNDQNISDLYINWTSDNVGLFATVGKDGTVHNLTVTDLSFTPAYSTGGIVGENYGIVDNVSAHGTISSTGTHSNIGGLVGSNEGSGTVTRSSANVTITVLGQSGQTGGLVGNNAGTIEQSTARGTVELEEGRLVGGLVGINRGTVNASSAEGMEPVAGSLQVGGLIGGNVGGTVHTSSANRTVTGDSDVGGLVGIAAGGQITDTSANTTVEGTTSVGGLVGANGGKGQPGSTITNASAGGTVSVPDNTANTEYVGGLVGQLYQGTVTTSDATVDVDAANSLSVGGLVGYNDEGEVTQSYATGNVTGNESVGGLVGNNTGAVYTAYATGGVTATDEVGGLVGNNTGQVSETYAVGLVNATETQPTSVGGLIGNDETMGFGQGYYDSETTNQTNQPGQKSTADLTGFSARAEMSTPPSPGGAGFDFQQNWTLPSNNGQVSYPILRANPQTPAPGLRTLYDGGNGTSESPYTISDWTHLNNTRENLNANFTLTNNLTAETDGYGTVASSTANGDHGFVPISGRFTGFTGTFDGQGFTIAKLTIDRPTEDNVGLFGTVSTGGGGTGTVRNLTLADVNVTGSRNVGAVTGTHGRAVMTIQNISVTGSVNGDEAVGGVVGVNRGHVRNVSVDGTVNGSIRVGGLVGDNSGIGGPTADGGTILNSHAGASVEAYGLVGGLVGANGDKKTFSQTSILYSGGTISNSSASGTVTVTASPSVTGERAGGLVGQMYLGNITRSSASVTVDAPDATHVGGLVGYADATERTRVRNIRESYATGDVTGNESVGGLVGTTRNETVVHSYAVGNVTGDTAVGGLVGTHTGANANVTEVYAAGTVSEGTDAGGLIGTTQESPTVESAYWDTQTTAQSSPVAGTGLTTSQLKANESLDGFDFQHTWDVVDNETHSSYPYLLNNTQSPPPGLHELAPKPGAGGDGNDDRNSGRGDSGQSNDDSSDRDGSTGNGASAIGGSDDGDGDDDRLSVSVRPMAQSDAAGEQDGDSDVAPTSTTGFVVSMQNVDSGEQITVDFTEQRRPTKSEETPSGESASRNVESVGLVLTVGEQGDYELTVTARDVDVFATAAESGDGDAEPSDGENTDDGEAESSGEVDLSTNAFDEESTRFVEATAARPVGFITVDHNFESEDLETATHRFRVRKSYLAATGATAESVTLYREEPESYRALSTRRVGEDDAFYYFEADTPGFSTFVIGTEAPIFDLGEPTLEQADVETGVIDASVPVENIGTEPGTYTVRLRGDGVVLAETEVSVPAGETVEATVRATVPDADGLALTIAGESLGEFTVEDSDADGSERTTDAETRPTTDAEDATDEPSDTADGSAPGGRFLVLLVAVVVVVVAVWALRRRDEP